jgi:hypothetical protein
MIIAGPDKASVTEALSSFEETDKSSALLLCFLRASIIKGNTDVASMWNNITPSFQ